MNLKKDAPYSTICGQFGNARFEQGGQYFDAGGNLLEMAEDAETGEMVPTIVAETAETGETGADSVNEGNQTDEGGDDSQNDLNIDNQLAADLPSDITAVIDPA